MYYEFLLYLLFIAFICIYLFVFIYLLYVPRILKTECIRIYRRGLRDTVVVFYAHNIIIR